MTNEVYIQKIDNFYKENPKLNYYDDVLAFEFAAYSSKHKYSRDLGDWNNHIVDEKENLNVIMFASGWGDGYYPTYWGQNDKNETVELTIDFMLNFEE